MGPGAVTVVLFFFQKGIMFFYQPHLEGFLSISRKDKNSEAFLEIRNNSDSCLAYIRWSTWAAADPIYSFRQFVSISSIQQSIDIACFDNTPRTSAHIPSNRSFHLRAAVFYGERNPNHQARV